MPRISRKNIGTTFLHVITQGINKEYIFDKQEDIKYYIKVMYQLKEKHNIKIHAYCIMNNHAHILIETDKIDNLSKYMQRLNTRYGKYYNKKYNRVGYVFRDRYKTEGIYDEKHLYNCINYIFNNPVKAGICEKASQYPFSNYKEIDKIYIGDYTFLDVSETDENDPTKIIQHILEYENEDLMELSHDKEKLKRIIKILKDEHKITFVDIGKAFEMGRERIRRLYYN